MVNLVELAQNGVEWAERYISQRCEDGTYKIPLSNYTTSFGSKTGPTDKEVDALGKAHKVLRAFDYLFDLPSDGEIEDPSDFDVLAEAAIEGLIPPQEALLRLNKAFRISGQYKYYTVVDFSDGAPNAPGDFGASPNRHYIKYDDSPKRIIEIYKRIVKMTGVDIPSSIRTYLDELDMKQKQKALHDLLEENS